MNRDDGRVVRGHGGLIPESPLAQFTTLTWSLMFGEFFDYLEVSHARYVITLHHEEGHCALGRGHGLNDEGGAPHSDLRHLLRAFDCNSNKRQGYLPFLDVTKKNGKIPCR